MLIGNKSDLQDKRQVSTAEAERFASAESLLFLETSALTADNVLPAFQKAAREVYKGVLTMKYTDVDANGELIGIQKGNVDVSATNRMSYNADLMNTSLSSDLMNASIDHGLNTRAPKQQKEGGCC